MLLLPDKLPIATAIDERLKYIRERNIKFYNP